MLRLILLILLCAGSAQAGFKKGNGGFVLICGNTATPTYQLLDLYEAENRYHFKIEFATQGDEFQRAQTLLNRLARLNPSRLALYQDWLQSFKDESVFLDDLNIIGVPDVGVTYIPDGCSLKQMIVQVEPTSYEKRYTIDRRLWNSLNVNQKAAAILHELIYREAISLENQQNSSQPSRLLNAFIHSEQMGQVHLRQWLLFLQDLGFHRADADGFPIRLNSFKDNSYSQTETSALFFYDDDHVSSASLPYKFNFTLQQTPLWYHCDKHLVSAAATSNVIFYPDGIPQMVYFGDFGTSLSSCPNLLFTLKVSKGPGLMETRILAPATEIDLDESGRVQHLSGSKAPLPADLAENSDHYFMLAIFGDHITVHRSFWEVQENWRFSIDINTNGTFHLENNFFNNSASSTTLNPQLKAPSQTLPNRVLQDIY